MAQTVLSVVLEAQSKGLSILRDLIEQLKHQEENPPPPHAGSYARLRSLVPTLHFMSISVFEDDHFDPLLVIEANFDGPQGPFWAQLEAAIGPQLREILRYCERPAGRTGETFDLITRPGSKHPLAPFLEAHTVTPMIFHQGNRGLDRRRIDRIALFRSQPGLKLLPDHRFNIEEYNTYSCPWHHNITAAIASFRVAKALVRNPGSRDQIQTFTWRNSHPFRWHSQQLMDLGLMEPGQWF